MNKHGDLHERIRVLRFSGLTYSEINQKLGVDIPKSSYSYICRGIVLNKTQADRIDQLSKDRLVITQKKAVLANRNKLDAKINGYRSANKELSIFMQGRNAKLVALSMLYLGEGAKWKGSRAPRLGSSDPAIVRLYIDLLKQCYDISVEHLRCRVQHRADQNPAKLISYWVAVTGVPKDRFYPSYVDKRTIGHPTQKTNYHGVCSVSCAGTYIQLELEQIAVIISEALRGIGAAG